MIPNEELDTLVSCSKSKKVLNKPILLEAIDYSSQKVHLLNQASR